MVEIACATGKSADWVADNMSFRQAAVFYRHMKDAEFDRLELQSRLVWAVASGWRRPVPMNEGGAEELKKMGMLEDAV